jgi:peptidoglycan hydrolase CwlO-like protein
MEKKEKKKLIEKRIDELQKKADDLKKKIKENPDKKYFVVDCVRALKQIIKILKVNREILDNF